MEEIRTSFSNAIVQIGALLGKTADEIRNAIADLYARETANWRPGTAYGLPIESERTRIIMHKENGHSVIVAKFSNRAKAVEILVDRTMGLNGQIVARRIASNIKLPTVIHHTGKRPKELRKLA